VLKRSKTEPEILRVVQFGCMKFETFFTQLIKMLSDFTLEILKKNEITVAIYTLKHCEYFINKFDIADNKEFDELRSVVYNYLACCYRR